MCNSLQIEVNAIFLHSYKILHGFGVVRGGKDSAAAMLLNNDEKRKISVSCNGMYSNKKNRPKMNGF